MTDKRVMSKMNYSAGSTGEKIHFKLVPATVKAACGARGANTMMVTKAAQVTCERCKKHGAWVSDMAPQN